MLFAYHFRFLTGDDHLMSFTVICCRPRDKLKVPVEKDVSLRKANYSRQNIEEEFILFYQLISDNKLRMVPQKKPGKNESFPSQETI